MRWYLMQSFDKIYTMIYMEIQKKLLTMGPTDQNI
jgi:hypothetical protein